MSLINFYFCAAGVESHDICNDVAKELDIPSCSLALYEQPEFHQKIINADVVIIVADLNNMKDVSNIEAMIGINEEHSVPILLYAIYPIALCSGVDKKGISVDKLDWIRNRTVLISQEDNYFESKVNQQNPLIHFYKSKGLSSLSINLLLGIKSIVSPMTRQEVIGVDFADYRLAFKQKGFYYTKLYQAECLGNAELDNDSWLNANIVIMTIYLNAHNAVNILSETSTLVSNMLKANNVIWLLTAVIEERVKGDPLIFITHD
jgi:hypothetical protein